MSPSPLTPEQLEQIAHETERAAHKALWHYTKRSLVGFAILVAGIVGAFHAQAQDRHTARASANDARHSIVKSANTVAITGCNRDYRQITAFNNAVVTSEKDLSITYANHEISKREYDARLKGIKEFVTKNPPPDCRLVAHVITDRPKLKIKLKHAFYPGDPQAPIKPLKP
jgi:hypothetical protein